MKKRNDDGGDRPPLRAPQQQRSADTLRRIVASARQSMRRKSFDDTTLEEVTHGAGVTVGAFYARFGGKEALLDLLEREAYDDLRARLSAGSAGETMPEGSTIEDGLRRFLESLAYLYSEHGGVLRSLLLSSRSDPRRQARRMRFTGGLIDQGVDQILSLEGTIEHENPRRSLKLALLFTTSALRDALLFKEDWIKRSGDSLSEEELVDELVRGALAYLEYLPPDPGER